MAYEKQNFVDGLPLSAEQLNHMEDGIKALGDEIQKVIDILHESGGNDIIIVPDYWQSYLTGKTVEIDSAINAADGNCSSFLWYTDAHWANNYKVSPVLLKYLSKNTGIPMAMPNPQPIEFNGAVTGRYNGSEQVTITIPTVPTVADILAALPTWNGGNF